MGASQEISQEGGSEFRYIDCYFVDMKKDESEEYVYYQNKIGDIDPEKSKDLKISDKGFFELIDKYYDTPLIMTSLMPKMKIQSFTT